MPKKTIVYVDGLNFFHGALKPSRNPGDRLPRMFRWLDVGALMTRTLSRCGCDVVAVKYFTSLVLGADNAAHDAYIRALRRHRSPGSAPLTVSLGEMELRDMQGRPPLKFKNERGHWVRAVGVASGAEISVASFREKRTDVNLASQMVADALLGRCERVALASIDRDFLGALRRVKEETESAAGLRSVEILLVSPRSRMPGEVWKEVASDFARIEKSDILDSRLPDPAGGVFCPPIWRE